MADFNEELIQVVQFYPNLWDKSRNDYKDAPKRINSWNAIATTLKQDENLCKTRWKSLRDDYFKIVNAKPKTGSAGPKVRRTFKYASQLEFLSITTKKVKSSTNIPSATNDESFDYEPVLIDDESPSTLSVSASAILPEESESDVTTVKSLSASAPPIKQTVKQSCTKNNQQN